MQAEIMTIQIVDTASVFQKAPKPEALEKLYTYRRSSEVAEFLKVHPFLVPLLVEAYTQIGNCFGSQTDVVLEVVRDPEVRTAVEIFGYIISTLTPDEAGRRLQQFDRNWFLKQLSRTKGLLNFDVEFR